ncbi:MAG TPA: hypothetical protein VJH88_03200 [Candidatus Nanoarchaeia archaeon]|nr:hypothetical protein [Candidatus Nanoarchaeia archaeon]
MGDKNNPDELSVTAVPLKTLTDTSYIGMQLTGTRQRQVLTYFNEILTAVDNAGGVFGNRARTDTIIGAEPDMREPGVRKGTLQWVFDYGPAKVTYVISDARNGAASGLPRFDGPIKADIYVEAPQLQIEAAHRFISALLARSPEGRSGVILEEHDRHLIEMTGDGLSIIYRRGGDLKRGVEALQTLELKVAGAAKLESNGYRAIPLH